MVDRLMEVPLNTVGVFQLITCAVYCMQSIGFYLTINFFICVAVHPFQLSINVLSY
jgi:hypothetical protein